MLSNISEKDLRDADPSVLTDHLAFATTYKSLSADDAMFASFILSPRFDNEYLKPWKQYFQEKFDRKFIEDARQDPVKIFDWVNENITIDNTRQLRKGAAYTGRRVRAESGRQAFAQHALRSAVQEFRHPGEDRDGHEDPPILFQRKMERRVVRKGP